MTSSTEHLVVISIRIPEGMLDEIDKIAEAEERSRSWIVRKAVQKFLEDKEKKGPA